MKLRTHQHNGNGQHFITNLNKERNRQDVEKSVKLNNNEDDETGTENNSTAGVKSSKPGPVEEDADSEVKSEDANVAGTTEIKVSPEQPLDELDLRLEEDDEVKK